MDEFLRQVSGYAPWIFSLLLALTVHEASHAFVADRLGDATPRLAGRLTLNPIAHLDIVGFLAILVAPIGWAKPVPVSPYGFKNPRWDMVKVALAGPASNLILAVLMSFAMRGIATVNVAGMSPEAERALLFAFLVARTGVMVNVGLAVFNMVPIPPLDGSRLLAAFLPPRAEAAYERMAPYAPFLLIALIFTGAIRAAIMPVIDAAMRLLVG